MKINKLYTIAVKSSSAKGTERAGSDNWPNVIVHKFFQYF